MAGLRRSVIFEPSFERSKALIEPDAKRCDELLDGLVWLLENDAESCPEMPGTPFRMARAAEVPESGILRLLFTISSDKQVSAWWVDRVASDLDDSEEDDY